MKKTLIDHLRAHSVNGVWTGNTESGVPVIRYESKTQPAESFLAKLGIKLKKTNKYTERTEHAGMGESQSEGNTSDVGNGVSQSQE